MSKIRIRLPEYLHKNKRYCKGENTSNNQPVLYTIEKKVLKLILFGMIV